MEDETSPAPESAHAAHPISIWLVLGVLFGAYLASYAVFRLGNEPPKQVLRAFYFHDASWSDHLEPIKDVWSEDPRPQMRVFHTLFWPCYMAEEWLIHEVLT